MKFSKQNPNQKLSGQRDGLVQERRNPIANALELGLRSTKPSIVFETTSNT